SIRPVGTSRSISIGVVPKAFGMSLPARTKPLMFQDNWGGGTSSFPSGGGGAIGGGEPIRWTSADEAAVIDPVAVSENGGLPATIRTAASGGVKLSRPAIVAPPSAGMFTVPVGPVTFTVTRFNPLAVATLKLVNCRVIS